MALDKVGTETTIGGISMTPKDYFTLAGQSQGQVTGGTYANLSDWVEAYRAAIDAGSSTLPTYSGYKGSTYYNSLADLEDYVAEVEAKAATPTATTPTANFSTTQARLPATTTEGVATQGAGLPIGESADRTQMSLDQINTDANALLNEYNSGQISYTEFSQRMSEIRNRMAGLVDDGEAEWTAGGGIQAKSTSDKIDTTYGLPSGYDPATTYSGSTAGTGGTSAGYGTTSGSGGNSELAREIYQEREDALAKQEDLYNQTKAAIDAAYTSGLMSDTEYNNLLTSARETVEAQYADLMERTSAAVQTGYGPSGYSAEAIRDVETGRIGAVAGGYRDIAVQRATRASEAAAARAAGYAGLWSQYQIPYPEMPQGSSREELYTGLTGKNAPGGINYGYTPSNYYVPETPTTRLPATTFKEETGEIYGGGGLLMPQRTMPTFDENMIYAGGSQYFNELTGEYEYPTQAEIEEQYPGITIAYPRPR